MAAPSYHIDSGEWEHLPDMATHRYHIDSGEWEDLPHMVTPRYHIDSEWEDLPDMACLRYCHGSVYTSGKVFIIGRGRSHDFPVFNLSSDT